MQPGYSSLRRLLEGDAVAREAEQIVGEHLVRLAAFYDQPTIEPAEL